MGVPVRRKNLHKLFAACRELRGEIPSLRLAVHVATYYDWLNSSNWNDIKSVDFVEWSEGVLSPPEVAAWYRRLSCYVYPSSAEGWSFTPRESICLGIPTALSAIPMHADLIDSGFCTAIPVRGTEPASYEGGVYGAWDRVEVDDIVRALKDIHENPDAFGQRARDGANWIANRWRNAETRQLGQYAEVALSASNHRLDSHHQPDGDVSVTFDAASFPDGVGIALGSVAFLPYAIGTPRILSTVWETHQFPEPHLRVLRAADQLWVPTEWGRQLFMAIGIRAESVRVVPEGVDTDLFCPAPPGDAPRRETYRFLCIGKWEVRKGTADLVRAFVEEFDASEPVELVMHCHNVYRSGFDAGRAIGCERSKFREPGPRLLVNAPCSLTELIRLIQDSDAFVLPTRAERGACQSSRQCPAACRAS